MKKILISIETYPPGYSGAGVRASRMIDRIHKEYGFNFEILCTQKKTKKKDKEKNITRLKYYSDEGIFFPIYLIIIFIQVNYYMLKHKEEINTIHFFSFSWFNRVLMFSNTLFYKKKTILEITLNGADDPKSLLTKGIKNKIFGQFTLFLLKRIDFFLVPSKASFNSCISSSIDPKKILIRAHPVDETLFGKISFNSKKELRKELNLPNKYILLTIGTLESRKNQMFIVKALKKLKTKNILLLIIGPECQEEKEYGLKLKTYIQKNQLTSQVRFIEPNSKINKYMIASDLFLFASKSEGFPNVIAESITSGLPFISLYLEGLDSINLDNIGIMIDKTPEKESIILKKYCSYILNIYKQKHIYNKKLIRQQGLKLFSSKIIDEKYAHIYVNLQKE
ncbi:MAG: glycosyltransferase family 4 protein [Candidatus Nanoarchaeia archaeon]